MKRILSITICLLLVVSLFSGCNGSKAEEAQPFKVGYAKGNVTPSTPSYLGGFFDPNERLSNAVMDPINATCVAFTDPAGTTVLLFGLDLLYIDTSLFNMIRNTISKENNIPVENILFSATHTHSAPHQDSANFEANDRITTTCILIAKQALEDRKPAQMYGTFTRPEGMNFVRHYVLSDGTYLGKGIGYFPKDQLIGHVHKADNLLQMIKFTREGGKDVIITNWQAHYRSATDVNYNGISADYPGIYKQTLEQLLDCHAAFVLGGSGNLNSTSHVPGLTTTGDYLEHGKKLAEHAVEAAKNFQPLELGNIHIKEEILTVEGNKNYCPLYVLGFGDFACAFAPFEIFDTNAKAVREASDWKYTFYASCSYGSYGNGYLPDALAFTYSCYEAYGPADKNKPYETYKEIEYGSRYTKFPDGTAEVLQEKLTAMLDNIFEESGNEPKQRDPGYMTEEFVPVSDGKVYSNLSLGDGSKVREGKGGMYYMQLLAEGNKMKNILILNKEVADQIVQQPTMKLLFDERNVVVGIAE